jgi:hypothetical protein
MMDVWVILILSGHDLVEDLLDGLFGGTASDDLLVVDGNIHLVEPNSRNSRRVRCG